MAGAAAAAFLGGGAAALGGAPACKTCGGGLVSVRQHTTYVSKHPQHGLCLQLTFGGAAGFAGAAGAAAGAAPPPPNRPAKKPPDLAGAAGLAAGLAAAASAAFAAASAAFLNSEGSMAVLGGGAGAARTGGGSGTVLSRCKTQACQYLCVCSSKARTLSTCAPPIEGDMLPRRWKKLVWKPVAVTCIVPCLLRASHVSIRYIRQHTSACVRIRQHSSGLV